jgi:hypothetical protein
LARTDELVSIPNRVVGRQVNRSSHATVPERMRDGGGIGRLRDTEKHPTADEGGS